MRLPAVINYPIEERVVFSTGPRTASLPAMYVPRKGNITTCLLEENSEGLREQF